MLEKLLLLCKYCSRLLLVSALFFYFQVAFAIDFGRIQPDEAAVYVQDLDSGEVLLAHRADVSMNTGGVISFTP